MRFKFPPPDGEIPAGAVKSLASMGAQIIAKTPELVALAVRVAYAYDLSVYDALFVALAQEVGMEWITADLRLQAQCEKMGVVRLLKEWKVP